MPPTLADDMLSRAAAPPARVRSLQRLATWFWK
jgi:hypothetical protein